MSKFLIIRIDPKIKTSLIAPYVQDFPNKHTANKKASIEAAKQISVNSVCDTALLNKKIKLDDIADTICYGFVIESRIREFYLNRISN
jgi:hypothetical protein